MRGSVSEPEPQKHIQPSKQEAKGGNGGGGGGIGGVKRQEESTRSWRRRQQLRSGAERSSPRGHFVLIFVWSRLFELKSFFFLGKSAAFGGSKEKKMTSFPAVR